jgi:putative transposase
MWYHQYQAQPKGDDPMSPVKPEFDPENLYFITTTAVNRTHLFLPKEHKQIIAHSLDYMRQKGWIKFFAFVIMPNHVHILVRILTPFTLAGVMRDFKKYTSKQIAGHCLAENQQELLSIMEEAGEVNKKSKYKVWEDGYDARDVYSLGFLEQKLDYIHNNPCQPQWNLVDQPEDYRWSSACFYLQERPAIIEVDDLREFLIS